MKYLAERRGLALLLALTLLLTALAGCGGQEADTASDQPSQQQTEGQETDPAAESGKPEGEPASVPPEATDEPTPEPDPEPDSLTLALEQYRSIAGQADTYDYGSDDPTGAYRYALVRMAQEDTVPALLLEQDTAFGISLVLVFQYDVGSGAVLQADGSLSEGVASAGGYRGSLSAAGDGNGLLSAEFSSGTGAASTYRVTLDGTMLQSEAVWEGTLGDGTDTTDTEIGYLEIDWHEIGDPSGLDSWTPPAAVPSQPDTGEPEPSEAAVPTDGDRIVFQGTLGAYSYSEVLALQGQADPNPGSDMGETYYLIVLDTPQTMNLRSGDGLSSRNGEVHLVNVSYVEGIGQYAGQHLTWSIDPSQTYWPSDTSLPLGEPSTDDVHILT